MSRYSCNFLVIGAGITGLTIAIIPEIRKEDIVQSKKVGIRPQLIDLESNTLVMDFVIVGDSNSLHILNAISPAFTSSMAFARMICDKITSVA